MDPDACLKRLINAIERNDTAEITDAYYDLRKWINNQGHEPKWCAGARNAFMLGVYTFVSHVRGGNEV